MIGRLWLALALAATAPVAPPDDGPLELDVRAADRQRLDQLGELGRKIFDFDQASRAAADAIAARVPAERLSTARGSWIVEPSNDGALSVTYNDRAKVLFSARWKDGRLFEDKLVPPGEARPLTPVEDRMTRAKDVATAQIEPSGFPRCAPKYNIIVLPPSAPDAPISVYVLTPQDAPGTFPVGGHMRFDVGADGRIVASRAFARACLSLRPERTPDGLLSAGRTAAMGTTHLLDNMPTEIHAYMSAWAGVPVFVGTPDERFWLVDRQRISLVSRTGPAGMRIRAAARTK